MSGFKFVHFLDLEHHTEYSSASEFVPPHSTRHAAKKPMIDYQELKQLEDDLWEAADQLRANSKLTATEYSMPVLGLIFLRHATTRFNALLPDEFTQDEIMLGAESVFRHVECMGQMH
ncbi:MAG: type I restriction-modification system subunit M N-terminal domain-containing protein [Gallionella sp.]|jgi:hypothetical protein